MSAQLEIRNLSKHFGKVHAVDDVSFSVESGEFLTVLGPSGSGKSTMLMLLAGFLEATTGDILINGESVIGLPAHKRSLGVVFQQYALFANMNVFKNIAFPLKARKVPSNEIERRVSDALDMVELGDMSQRRINELSGGQQQRVALARALVFDPPLLLMDEPLSALDRKLRETMQIELQRLHRRMGVTVIYVTHDQSEALTLSDRVAVMDHGVVQQLDKPRVLYERPANEFVAGFLGESNLFSCKIVDVSDSRTQYQLDSGDIIEGPGLEPAVSKGRSRVDIMVRPQRVGIADAAEPQVHGAVNELSGKVSDVIYLGSVTKYIVVTGAGEVTAIIPNSGSAQAYAPDSAVVLYWPTDATTICSS